ncbi:MAG TPA: hypothetical protein VGR78_01130 [Verrucomicrobiae bacterium]|nr:hypothetical protein [Verrucomicrobiae bacterium]
MHVRAETIHLPSGVKVTFGSRLDPFGGRLFAGVGEDRETNEQREALCGSIFIGAGYISPGDGQNEIVRALAPRMDIAPSF